MIAGLAALLLGINVGMLYYAQRDLQRLAALAAAAGVEGASGCNITTGTKTAGVPGSLDAVTTRVKQALIGNSAANADTTGLLGIKSQNGFPPDVPGVQVGRADYSTGKFIFVPLNAGDAKVDSVRVTLSRPAPTVIGGTLFTGKSGTLYASSTAWQPAIGSFFLGTGLAALNSSSGTLLGPLLNALFGSSVNLAVLNSAGLAQTQVNLAQLMLAANVTDLNSLTNLNISLTRALNILGQAVSGTGGGLISGLGAQAYNGTGGPTQQYFGDIFNTIGTGLNPTVGDVASAVPFVDAMDLLTALAEDAAKGGPIKLQPGNDFLTLINIPNTMKLDTFVTIIQPQQFAVGPAIPSTQAKSAQITLNVRIAANILALVTANLGVDLQVAAGTGTLTSLQCPVAGRSNPSATVGVTTDLANVVVGPFDPTEKNEPLGHGTLLNIGSGLVTAKLHSQTIKGTVGSPATNSTGPYDTYTSVQGTVTNQGYSLQHQTLFKAVAPDNTDTVGSTLILSSTINSLFSSLTANNNLDVCVLLTSLCIGPLVDPILSALSAVLTPVAVLLDQVLQLLMQLLGLQLGTATVTMYGATIGQPVIVTNCVPIPGDPTKSNVCPVLGG